MKTKNLLILSMCSLLTMFISCSKSDDSSSTPAPNPTPSSGLLTAKINGAAWAPSADSATASLINGEINITGVARDGKTITITLTDTVTGTYDLGNSGMHAGVYQTSPSASSSYNSNYGPWDGTVNTLTIASIDKTNKKMTGTFSFKAYNFSINDSITISEGAFNNLPYVTSIGGTGNNTFSVDINGTPYVPTLISGVVSGGNINIVASANSGSQSVGIYVPETITPGTYTFAPFGTYNAQYNPNSSTFLLVDNGTITITQHNTVLQKIVGTFSFTASEFGGGTATANLTNGSFTIFY